MKRLFFKLFMFVPLGLLIVGVNVCMDPAHILDRGYSQGIADILLSTQNVVNVKNCNERLVQRHYIQACKQIPNVIALGSSRVMQIRSSLFPQDVFFNHGLSGASIEDLMGIYHLYRNRGRFPSTIYVGLDPWFFNRRSDEMRWLTLRQEYLGEIETCQLEDVSRRRGFSFFGHIDRLREMISLSYFQASIKAAWQQYVINEPVRLDYYPSDSEEHAYRSKAVDGSRLYPVDFRRRSPAEVRTSIEKMIADDDFRGMNNFISVDQAYMDLVIAFLECMQRDGVDVRVILCPYHPLQYEYFSQHPQYGVITNIEAELRARLLPLGVPVYGSYNPHECSLTANDFFDFHHPRPEVWSDLLFSN